MSVDPARDISATRAGSVVWRHIPEPFTRRESRGSGGIVVPTVRAGPRFSEQYPLVFRHARMRGETTRNRRDLRAEAQEGFSPPPSEALSVRFFVRRGKARISSGCNSRPATWVAPAGSNRSGGGGNETAGATDAKGRSGDSASRQAVTRVNAEQASKCAMWEPTRHKIGEGRSRWGDGGHTPRSDRNQRSHRGSGDGMPAEEIRRNTGSPERWGRDPNRKPVRARPGRPGWRTGPKYRGRRVMPAEGRGLSSRPAPEGA